MSTITQLRGLDLQMAVSTRASQLPPISSSVAELTSVCVRADWLLEDACAVIDRDPLLLGALLREANSAVFGSSTLVDSGHDAVVRLGAARVMAISVDMGLERLLGNGSEYGPGATDLFRHSYISSIAADVVRERSGANLPQAFAAAALMHDIGELVLAHFVEESSMLDLSAAYNRGLSTAEAERSVLELDHAEVTAIICQQWFMPEIISHAIHHHHAPWATDDPLTYAVALADQVAVSATSSTVKAKTGDSLTVGRCMVELQMVDTTLNDLAKETNSRVKELGRRF